MKAYLLRNDTPISPFAEPAAQMGVGTERLRDWQDRLLEARGLEPVRVDGLESVPTNEDRLVLTEDLFFSRRVLKSFLERWRDGPRRIGRVALPASSSLLAEMGTLQRYDREGEHALFDMWLVPAGERLVAEPGEALGRPRHSGSGPVAAVPVAFREKVIEVPIPRAVTGRDRWLHPVTSSVCLHLEHWVHVLQAGRLAVQIRWVDTVVRRPVWAASRLALALAPWPGRGRFLWRLLGQMNLRGRGVDVHPTARIEGAILEDGVRVGAQALVRASVVGAGTVIEDRATVAYSSIGPQSFVSKYTLVYASAAFAEANLGMSMQMCLAGRRAALTPRATPVDVVPGGEIRVRLGDALVPVDLPVLGSCFGHDTFIGADVYLAPGREIPSGVRIGPRPERILSRIPDDLEPGRSYVAVEGRLEPS